MIFRFLDRVRALALNSKTISKILSLAPLGTLAFRTGLCIKRISLFYGQLGQRVVEYPWVLQQLKLLKPRALVLDVGCAESLLSHELIARRFRVVGLDLREYPFENKRMIFIQRNVLNTGLPNDLFDAILLISTVEHVGLGAYGQAILDEDGDIKAVKELWRILKPGGIMFITTPFIGSESFRILPDERNYDWEHLKRLLVKGAIILRDEYFYPIKHGRRFVYIKLKREQAIRTPFKRTGIACVILQKPTYIV